MIRINLLDNKAACAPCLAEKASCAAELLCFRSGEAGLPVERVMVIAARLGAELGLSEEQRDHVRLGALLHDIGKLAIPDGVLEKAGPLTDDEWKIMRSHTWKGGAVLFKMGFPRPISNVAFHHHENWDGSGYPSGLCADKISFTARVVKVADAFDAMVSKRCYRDARPYEVAIGELTRYAGIQFDPAIVDAFVRIPVQELAC